MTHGETMTTPELRRTIRAAKELTAFSTESSVIEFLEVRIRSISEQSTACEGCLWDQVLVDLRDVWRDTYGTEMIP